MNLFAGLYNWSKPMTHNGRGKYAVRARPSCSTFGRSGLRALRSCFPQFRDPACRRDEANGSSRNKGKARAHSVRQGRTHEQRTQCGANVRGTFRKSTQCWSEHIILIRVSGSIERVLTSDIASVVLLRDMRSCTAVSYVILVDSLLNQKPLVETEFQLKMTAFWIGQIHSNSTNTFELTGA